MVEKAPDLHVKEIGKGCIVAPKIQERRERRIHHVVKYQTSQTGEVDVQNIVGTSRKKMRGESKNAESEYTIENPQKSQEYWVISLNCVSTAV